MCLICVGNELPASGSFAFNRSVCLHWKWWVGDTKLEWQTTSLSIHTHSAEIQTEPTVECLCSGPALCPRLWAPVQEGMSQHSTTVYAMLSSLGVPPSDSGEYFLHSAGNVPLGLSGPDVWLWWGSSPREGEVMLCVEWASLLYVYWRVLYLVMLHCLASADCNNVGFEFQFDSINTCTSLLIHVFPLRASPCFTLWASGLTSTSWVTGWQVSATVSIFCSNSPPQHQCLRLLTTCYTLIHYSLIRDSDLTAIFAHMTDYMYQKFSNNS